MAHEMFEYAINFLYLACFFSVFTWYRRLILASYQIAYLNYGVSIVEALVLAKVIMIGDLLHLGRRFEEKPLYVRAFYKTFIFSLLVGSFTLLEHYMRGVLTGKGQGYLWEVLKGPGKYEFLARCLVTFFSFIPFFTVREMARVLGKRKMIELFFRRGTATDHSFQGSEGTFGAPS